MPETKSVINRGKRIIRLKAGPDGVARVLHPGKSIECLDDAEFALLTRYMDIADAAKILPQFAAKQEHLERELAKVKAENERLKKQSEATPAPEPVALAPEPEEPKHKEEKPKRKKEK